MSSVIGRLESDPGSLFAQVPIELHGHRKKLEFIWRCVDRYRKEHGMTAAQVRVLEVGCSNGRNIATPLAQCGYDVTGIDLHEESIAYAKLHTRLPNARFMCHDLAALGAHEKFEIVVLSDVLEHVEDPASICSMSMRYLVQGGRVQISIPNGYGPYELEQRFLRVTHLHRVIDRVRAAVNRLLGRTVSGPEYNQDSGHIQFFHLHDFHRLLDRVGLDVIEKSNGALFGGALTYMFGKIPLVVVASLKLADWLPQRWVSTWYFSCVARRQ